MPEPERELEPMEEHLASAKDPIVITPEEKPQDLIDEIYMYAGELGERSLARREVSVLAGEDPAKYFSKLEKYRDRLQKRVQKIEVGKQEKEEEKEDREGRKEEREEAREKREKERHEREVETAKKKEIKIPSKPRPPVIIPSRMPTRVEPRVPMSFGAKLLEIQRGIRTIPEEKVSPQLKGYIQKKGEQAVESYQGNVWFWIGKKQGWEPSQEAWITQTPGGIYRFAGIGRSGKSRSKFIGKDKDRAFEIAEKGPTGVR